MLVNNSRNYCFIAGLLLSLGCSINLISWVIFNKNGFMIGVVLLIIGAGCFFTLLETPKKWPIILFFILISFICLQTASSDWDARSIWLFRAKKILLENNLYAQLDGYIGHADYPAAFPSLAASMASVIGTWNEVFPKSAVLPFILAPLIIIGGHFKNLLAIIFLPAAVALTCKINLINGYMDGLVALHTAAVIFLQLKQSDQSNPQIIHPYLYGALLFSLLFNLLNLKNEGLAIVAILFLITSLTHARTSKKIVLLAYLSALCSYVVIWKIPVALHQQGTDLFSSGFMNRILSRAIDINNFLLIFGKTLSDLWKWLIPFALLLLPKYRHQLQININKFRLPLFFCLIYLVVLITIYLGTPHDLKWHLSTSVGRAITPITLIIFLIMIDWLDKSPYLTTNET